MNFFKHVVKLGLSLPETRALLSSDAPEQQRAGILATAMATRSRDQVNCLVANGYDAASLRIRQTYMEVKGRLAEEILSNARTHVDQVARAHWDAYQTGWMGQVRTQKERHLQELEEYHKALASHA